MIQFDLKNRVAVITGGAQGFGFSIAERFIQSGAIVIIWDLDEEAAKKAFFAASSSKSQIITIAPD